MNMFFSSLVYGLLLFHVVDKRDQYWLSPYDINNVDKQQVWAQ